jgi:hypothetical protein
MAAGLTPSCKAQTIRVDITPSHATNTFKPTEALGAGVDRIPLAATDKIFTEPVLKKILSTGWQTVTYRQNTELFVEAWHWNPKGKWSEAGEKGYFVGDSEPVESIRHSFGYPLPHAGFSQPDGRGYSRSPTGIRIPTVQPYLTGIYGRGDKPHPQWVVDLASLQEINAIRIDWVDPMPSAIWSILTGEHPMHEAKRVHG